jgi:tetratricopeptide (TPR) repeat protein
MVIGRTDPCPCGSGKRYLNCHGAVAAVQSVDPLVQRPPLARRAQLMQRALTLHREGNVDQARQHYLELLAENPDDFDALHLAGVTWYLDGQFVAAEELIQRALALRPSAAAALSDLALVQREHDAAQLEQAFCRRMLPLLAKRCVVPSGDAQRVTGDLHVFIPGQQPAAEFVVACAQALSSKVRFWRAETIAQEPGAIAIDFARGRFPFGGALAVARPCRALGEWYERAAMERVLLFIESDDVCGAVDGVNAASRDGQLPIELIYRSDEIARCIGLPGRVCTDIVTRRDAR